MGYMLEVIGKNFDVHHLTELGLECQHVNPDERPTMEEVLTKLEDIAKNVVSGRVLRQKTMINCSTACPRRKSKLMWQLIS